MLFHSLDKYRDAGLLMLRIGIGIMFILHGYPKLEGGPEVWARVGGALSHIGITFAPVYMGFMAAITEVGGGLLLILGLFTRPACLFLLVTMTVAAVMHISQGDPFSRYSHSVEAAILFFSLLFIGPGRFSLDQSIYISKYDG